MPGTEFEFCTTHCHMTSVFELKKILAIRVDKRLRVEVPNCGSTSIV